MARISQRRVRQYLSRARTATTARAKGNVFEDLICYLLEAIPGLSITTRDFLNRSHSEEIDIAVWNDQLPTGLRSLHHVILIEAKNWSQPAGAPEVGHFISKLRSRRLPLGFFVALNGITGDPARITAARDAIRMALREGIQVIVINRTDIESFTSGANIVKFIKAKVCELAVCETQSN